MLASLGQYFAILCRRTARADDDEPTASEASAVFRGVAKEYLRVSVIMPLCSAHAHNVQGTYRGRCTPSLDHVTPSQGIRHDLGCISPPLQDHAQPDLRSRPEPRCRYQCSSVITLHNTPFTDTTSRAPAAAATASVIMMLDSSRESSPPVGDKCENFLFSIQFFS
jgi:hypothetical protein